MFNNLIESSSHAGELKRRGSFVLVTTATYLLLMIGAGVASIYAYDAQLSDPAHELELISFVPPELDKPVPEPERVRRNNPPAAAAGPRSTRPELIDRTSNPLNPPKNVSAIASAIPPANPGSIVGSQVLEPGGAGTPGDGRDGNPNGNGNVPEVRTTEPPPAPTPAPEPPPKRILRSGRVLNSEALSLPKPPYPPIAKRMGVQGTVNVQVLIDETGKVVSAKAVSGNPILIEAAQRAAFGARFSPTFLSEQAVKVSGVITYNFVLQ